MIGRGFNSRRLHIVHIGNFIQIIFAFYFFSKMSVVQKTKNNKIYEVINEGWQDLLHGQLGQDFQIANLSSCQPSNVTTPVAVFFWGG